LRSSNKEHFFAAENENETEKEKVINSDIVK